MGRIVILGCLGLGCLAVILSVMAPYIGLERAERFLFYRWLGWTRGDVFMLGSVVLAGLGGLWLGWRLLTYRLSDQAVPSPLARLKAFLAPGLGVCLIGLVLLLGLAESLMRWSHPVAPQADFVFDPKIGFRPSAGSVDSWTNYVDFSVNQKANSLGFYDEEPLARPEDATCRIGIIGDSFVEAVQVPLEDKLQIQLRSMLQAHYPQERFATMALGIQGTGQINQLAFYDQIMKDFAPHMVILVFTANDFSDNSYLLQALLNGWHPLHAPRLLARRDDDGQFRLIPIDPYYSQHAHDVLRGASFMAASHHILKRYSLFYSWLLNHLYGAFPSSADFLVGNDQAFLANKRFIETIEGFEDAFRGWRWPDDVNFLSMFSFADMPPVFEEALDLTGYALDLFAERAREDGFSLMILAGYTLSGEDSQKGLMVHGRRLAYTGLERLEELAFPRQIPVIDQAAYIRERGGRIADARMQRDGHWSAQGHRWSAEALFRSIIENPGCPLGETP